MNKFIRRDRNIYFLFNGKKEIKFTKTKDGISAGSKSRIVACLNHFLYYVENFCSEYEMDIVEKFIIGKFTECVSRMRVLNNDSNNYSEEIDNLIKQQCGFDNQEEFIDVVAKYVINNTSTNIDLDKYDISNRLTNENATCLTIMSVLIRFSYVISSIIRCDKIFKKCLPLFLNNLNKNAIGGYLRVSNKPDTEDDVDRIDTEIDAFMFSQICYLWDKYATKSAFITSFKERGTDQTIITEKNKIDLADAMCKYCPSYKDDNEHGEDYWVEGKPFEEFAFKNLKLATYVQTTLDNVVRKQDFKQTFSQKINYTSVLTNINDDNSFRREGMLYENKEEHLMEIRKDSALSLFRDVVNAFEVYDFDLRKELNQFNCNNNHPFNQFVLSKILLSLTGEHRIYKEFFGDFAKVILALFYVRIYSTKEFEFLCKDDTMMLMKCEGRPQNELYTVETVEDYLTSKKETIDPYLFRSILGVYRSRDGKTYSLKLAEFYWLFKFLESPARVRNFLFPDRYGWVSDETPQLEKITKQPVKFAMSVKDKILKGVY